MSHSRPTSQFSVSDIECHQAFKKPRISEAGTDSNRRFHYKTRLCINFKRGRCHYGEACLYAHGVKELRNKMNGLENEKGVLGSRTVYGNNNHGKCDRLEMCHMFFKLGRCAYGETCRFRHVNPRSNRDDDSVINISCGNGGCGQFGGKSFVGLDVGTSGGSGGRHFRQQSSVGAGRGVPSNTCIASGSFAHGHGNAVLRNLRGYSTLETKYSKACTMSREMQVRDGKFDWNEFGKMSRIYADWIEEIPLVHGKL